MHTDLKRWFDDNHFEKYCTLDAIDESCPWKRFQGLSHTDFISENFSTLKPSTNAFEETFKTSCVDVAFIETFVEQLDRKYWFCLYYFGDDKDGKPKYCIGGEPEENILFSAELKEKTGMQKFPEFLMNFWRIHGFWDQRDSYGESDFDLNRLSKDFTVSDAIGEIPHYRNLIHTGEEVE